MNHTNIYHDVTISQMSNIQDFLIGAFLCLLALLGTGFNGVVMAALSKERDWKEFEICVVNICAVDFAQCLLYPLVAVTQFFHRWLYGDIGCRLYAFGVTYLSVCSYAMLALLSISRYIRVCQVDYVNWIKNTRMKLYILLCYLTSLFWAGAPLFGWGKYGHEGAFPTCTFDWEFIPTSYFVSFMVFGVLIPCGVMIFSYVRIILYMSGPTRFPINAAQKYVIKLTFFMCGAFVLSWAGYAVIAIICMTTGASSVPVWLRVLTVLVAKSAPIYDPLIYCFAVRSSRTKMKAFVLSICGWQPQNQVGAEPSNIVTVQSSMDVL